jgi:uncharacterized protein (DUF2062 family)
MFGRLWRRFRVLWRLATTERATPRQVALAVGLGAFIGSTPVVGLHGWIAVGLATVLRLNRLYAFLGSRVSSPFVLPFIVIAEIEIAHRVRSGEFIALTRSNVLEEAKSLLLDWCLGTAPIALVVGTLVGAAGYGLTVLRDRHKRKLRELEGQRPSNENVSVSR